jgi:hypothetical protein
MGPDFKHWRCMCGETNNQADHLKCNKCSKQRWSQLGFGENAAVEVILALLPLRGRDTLTR